MRKTRISEWPEVRAFVHPDTKANLQAHAEDRALDVADLVREALDKAYRAAR